jgi:hypothetical protein
MPGIAQALSALKRRSAVIDGEAIMNGANGAPDFFALHAALAKGGAPGAILMVFDLMYLNAEDVRQSPLVERRNMLLSILLLAATAVLARGWWRWASCLSSRLRDRAGGDRLKTSQLALQLRQVGCVAKGEMHHDRAFRAARLRL